MRCRRRRLDMRCVPRREQEDPAGHDLLRVGQGAAVVLGAIAVESVDVAVSHRVAELGGRDVPQVVTGADDVAGDVLPLGGLSRVLVASVGLRVSGRVGVAGQQQDPAGAEGVALGEGAAVGLRPAVVEAGDFALEFGFGRCP